MLRYWRKADDAAFSWHGHFGPHCGTGLAHDPANRSPAASPFENLRPARVDWGSGVVPVAEANFLTDKMW